MTYLQLSTIIIVHESSLNLPTEIEKQYQIYILLFNPAKSKLINVGSSNYRTNPSSLLSRTEAAKLRLTFARSTFRNNEMNHDMAGRDLK